MDRVKIEQELVEFFSTKETLNPTSLISEDTNLIEAGLDSMIMIELLLFIEEKYGFWIPEAYLTEEIFKNIKALSTSIIELSNNKNI